MKYRIVVLLFLLSFTLGGVPREAKAAETVNLDQIYSIVQSNLNLLSAILSSQLVGVAKVGQEAITPLQACLRTHPNNPQGCYGYTSCTDPGDCLFTFGNLECKDGITTPCVFVPGNNTIGNRPVVTNPNTPTEPPVKPQQVVVFNPIGVACSNLGMDNAIKAEQQRDWDLRAHKIWCKFGFITAWRTPAVNGTTSIEKMISEQDGAGIIYRLFDVLEKGTPLTTDDLLKAVSEAKDDVEVRQILATVNHDVVNTYVVQRFGTYEAFLTHVFGSSELAASVRADIASSATMLNRGATPQSQTLFAVLKALADINQACKQPAAPATQPCNPTTQPAQGTTAEQTTRSIQKPALCQEPQITFGREGGSVMALQAQLASEGYLSIDSVVGVYGPQTDKALKNYCRR